MGEELFDCHVVTGDLTVSFAFDVLGHTTIHRAKRFVCIGNRINSRGLNVLVLISFHKEGEKSL